MQQYCLKIAPWIDACDLKRQFELEVPRRAMHTPNLLYAILSLSSRHQAIMLGHSQHEASFYHGQCLRLVIDALSAAESLYDDNLLATVVLLRVYEEIDHSTDLHFHLHGMSKLLKAIPKFSHSGGLAEAASWQALRQDSKVSLTLGTPLTFALEPYQRSCVVSFRDDAACANMVILLFAKIIRFINTERSAKTDDDTWDTLEAQLSQWSERRKRLFEPLFSGFADDSGNQRSPVMVLLNAPQGEFDRTNRECIPLTSAHSRSHATLRSLPGLTSLAQASSYTRNWVSGDQASPPDRSELRYRKRTFQIMTLTRQIERCRPSPFNHHRHREVESYSGECQFHSPPPP
jgi:hypothetical protein